MSWCTTSDESTRKTSAWCFLVIKKKSKSNDVFMDRICNFRFEVYFGVYFNDILKENLSNKLMNLLALYPAFFPPENVWTL